MNENNRISAVAAGKLMRVIEWLEKGAPHVEDNGVIVDGFDMRRGIARDGCGTTCCIAGALVQFEKPFTHTELLGISQSVGGELMWNTVRNRAMRVLGLDPDDEEDWKIAKELFRPGAYNNDEITPSVAAITLRHFLETGEVKFMTFLAQSRETKENAKD